MTDREMLDLAAKAAGWPQAEYQDMQGWGEVRYGFSHALYVPEIEAYWNPLVDDGNALRLAATLKIDIDWQSTKDMPEPTVEAYRSSDDGYPVFCATEPEVDYRRAITRAAAEIGKAMQETTS